MTIAKPECSRNVGSRLLSEHQKTQEDRIVQLGPQRIGRSILAHTAHVGPQALGELNQIGPLRSSVSIGHLLVHTWTVGGRNPRKVPPPTQSEGSRLGIVLIAIAIATIVGIVGIARRRSNLRACTLRLQRIRHTRDERAKEVLGRPVGRQQATRSHGPNELTDRREFESFRGSMYQSRVCRQARPRVEPEEIRDRSLVQFLGDRGKERITRVVKHIEKRGGQRLRTHVPRSQHKPLRQDRARHLRILANDGVGHGRIDRALGTAKLDLPTCRSISAHHTVFVDGQDKVFGPFFVGHLALAHLIARSRTVRQGDQREACPPPI